MGIERVIIGGGEIAQNFGVVTVTVLWLPRQCVLFLGGGEGGRGREQGGAENKKEHKMNKKHKKT